MIPCYVELYDNNLARKNTFQTGHGNFVRCEFTLGESGCLGFNLQFNKEKSIVETDIVKIKIAGSTSYFYTGVVRDTPISGSSTKNYTYSGIGFNDYLSRLNSQSQSYANPDTISTVLTDLLDNIIVPSSPIVKNAGKLVPPAITLTSLESDYAQIPEVLDTLKNIANSEGDYIYGVDQAGEFFFRPRSTTIMAMLTVGATGNYGIAAYNPEYTDEPVSKIYLKDKDGVYIAAYTSIEDIDINELKLSAPDIDNADAAKWAGGILAEKEIQQKRASITWRIEESSPVILVGDGRLRIISNIPPLITQQTSTWGTGTWGSGPWGGYPYTGFNLDDTLRVMQVRYVISADQAVREIDLGTIPVSLDEQLIAVNKKLTELTVSLGR